MKRLAQSYFEIMKMYPTFRIIRPIPVSDEEASTLYNMWLKAPPGSNQIVAGGKPEVLKSLQTKGYIRGSANAVEITDKGRAIIVEMVTNAPNALDGKPMPTYRQIKLKADSMKNNMTKRSGK